jgi:hypothetical protein
MQAKLNISLKHWEQAKTERVEGGPSTPKVAYVSLYGLRLFNMQKTSKMATNCDYSDLVVGVCRNNDENVETVNSEAEADETPVSLLEYCDATLLLWKALRVAQPIIDNGDDSSLATDSVSAPEPTGSSFSRVFNSQPNKTNSQ